MSEVVLLQRNSETLVTLSYTRQHLGRYMGKILGCYMGKIFHNNYFNVKHQTFYLIGPNATAIWFQCLNSGNDQHEHKHRRKR